MTHQEDQQISGTLGIQVYHVLRRRILAGEWLPGQKLTLRAMSEDLGTSVQPVREALGRLASENVVSVKPNYSVTVAAIDRARIEALWQAKLILEPEALRLASDRLTEEHFASLDEAVVQLKLHHFARRSISLAARMTAMLRTGEVVANACGAPVIAAQIRSLQLRTAPFLAAVILNEDPPDWEFYVFSIRVQEECVAALRRGDAAAAAHLRASDIYSYKHHILRRLNLEATPATPA